MKTLLSLWLLLTATVLGEALSLTPAQAVQKALEANSTLAVVRYEPSLRQAEVMERRGEFDPFLSLGADRVDFQHSSVESFGAKLEHKIAYGATYSLETRIGTSITGQRGSSTRLNLRVPLLRGAGAEVNRGEITIARKRLDISQLQFQVESLDLAARVEEQYWALVMAQRILTVRERAVKQAEEFKQLLLTEIEVGAAAPFELYEAEQNLATRRTGVESAKGNLLQAQQRLARLLGLTPGKQALQAEYLAPEARLQALEEYQKVALEKRPLLKVAKDQLELLKIRKQMSDNELLPRLDIVAGHSLGRDTLSPYRWQAGVEFSFPLGNHRARGRVRQNKLAREQALARKEDLRQRVLLETTLAHTAAEAARRQSLSAAEASVQAAKRLESETARFSAGFTPSHRVIFAQQQQVNSDEESVQAQILQQLALVALRRASGTTLENHGLIVDRREKA